MFSWEHFASAHKPLLSTASRRIFWQQDSSITMNLLPRAKFLFDKTLGNADLWFSTAP